MQLYQLKIKNKKKAAKRVGRGGKKGTYSGRGVKGQKARAGKKPRPGFSGGDTLFFKRLPKKRGQRGSLGIKQGKKLFRLKNRQIVLNLKDISKYYKSGEVVSPKSLLEKGLVGRMGGSIPKVKILGFGEVKKELKFEGVSFSKSAKSEAIKSGVIKGKSPNAKTSKPAKKAKARASKKK